LTLFDDFDPDTSWLRTQTSYSPLGSIESFEKYSAPWPTTGLLSSGPVSRRAPWVHHTHDDDCSLWPTPTAAMGHRGWGLGRRDQGRYRESVIDRVHGVIALVGHWRPHIGCDSADGTYVAFGPDVNLPDVLAWLRAVNGQSSLDLGAVS